MTEDTLFESIGQIRKTRKPVQVIRMDSGRAASADGVVRMVLQQEFPGMTQKGGLIETPVFRRDCKHDAQRFQSPLQLRLRTDIGDLQRNP